MIRLLVVLACVGLSQQTRLLYFIGAVEVEWDYAPSGRNGITGEDFTANSFEAKYVLNGPDRVGSIYKKAVYREFTDDSFTTQIPHPAWLGTLGPVLRGTVGDTFVINFKNLATRPYTMHPHGVFYEKNSEGAIYEDGTTGNDKDDDGVAPGETYQYVWKIIHRAGPSLGDSGCISWQYHSHIKSPYGTNSGMVGPMIICRHGFLRSDLTRVDVDKEFVLMVTVMDENLSYYVEDNIQNFCTDPESVDPEDDDFLESNKMRGINGYVYGNLPGLEVCLGDRVAWHIFGMGTEIDVHTITFNGNEMTQNEHIKDVYEVSPAAIFNAQMRPRNPGTWLVTSNVITHAEAGMQALYTVRSDCGWKAIEQPLHGQVREYFIAAVKELWNYAPSGINHADITNLTERYTAQSIFFESSPERIGGSYYKYLFREFTDGSFETPISMPDDEQHLGILGPMIRAEVGDTIRVHFKNTVDNPLNIHPSGVAYNKGNEGMKYDDGTSDDDKADDEVAPGDTFVYEWTIPENVGPMERDAKCLTNVYRSTVHPVRDYYSGLIGPLLVCKSGTLNEHGRQTSVDQEYFLLFSRFDESQSWLIDENIAEFAPNAHPEDEDFIASNQMEAVNGLSYGNVPDLKACKGDTISWHLSGFGRETDHHTVYFHGASFVHNGRRRDSFPLLPGLADTVQMLVEKEGLWSIDCMTIDHFVNGMQAFYQVYSCEGDSSDESPDDSLEEDETLRTIYMAAVEILWDYSPIRYDPVRSISLDDEDSNGNVFVKQGDTFIGSTYIKAVFREFTDETFTEEKSRQTAWGNIGPPIYIQAGETIRIVFKNNASRPYSIHSHGLFSGMGNTWVEPGQTNTFIWTLPFSWGPTRSESRCIPYIYHSDVSFEKDIFSGLVGPLVACKRGDFINGDQGRTDVDREIFLLFLVSDENKSWYQDENINTFCFDPAAVDRSDAEFEESNLMHGINGFIYTNLKGLTMKIDEKVEWYLMAMGNEVDLHSVHFHGQTIVYRSEDIHRADVFELFPGVVSALRMIPDDPGEWLLHCHVNDHMLAGMETTYTVT